MSNFSLKELTSSTTATRLGIDNTPSVDITTNLNVLILGLELVRSILGDKPMRIDSGYRCIKLNNAVGGAKNSAHLDGYAADFTCNTYGTPLDIVKAISQSTLGFDQIIQEGTWVHISFDPAMRRQVLTAHFGSGGTTYSKGI